MSTRNIFDRQKREAQRQRAVALFSWACFFTLFILAFDRVGGLSFLF